MIFKGTRMTWLKRCTCEWTILNQCIMEVLAFFLVREIFLARFTLELDLIEYLVLKNLLLSFHILALADRTLSAFNLIYAFSTVDCLTWITHTHIHNNMEADWTLELSCEFTVDWIFFWQVLLLVGSFNCLVCFTQYIEYVLVCLFVMATWSRWPAFLRNWPYILISESVILLWSLKRIRPSVILLRRLELEHLL